MNADERLARLEQELTVMRRRNRLMWYCLGLVIVGLGTAWLHVKTVNIAQAQVPETKSIRATEFILEDQNGDVRAALAVTKDGPGLGIYDPNGTTRVALAVTKDRPGLGLYDAKGKTIWVTP
jgi:hypothetical protein